MQRRIHGLAPRQASWSLRRRREPLSATWLRQGTKRQGTLADPTRRSQQQRLSATWGDPRRRPEVNAYKRGSNYRPSHGHPQRSVQCITAAWTPSNRVGPRQVAVTGPLRLRTTPLALMGNQHRWAAGCSAEEGHVACRRSTPSDRTVLRGANSRRR
jgi:hypothetical protein